MIEVKDVKKSFNGGTVEVLKGISLSIKDGEFLAVLGASGSGKSTALNVISGLERADAGEIFYGDCNISNLTDKQLTEFRRKNVGFVFQRYYLLSHLSVNSNVRMGADLVGNKNYLEFIEAVGLKDKLKCKPATLSGGEQQRVCIARALAKNPYVLFLDEPTGALDEETGRSVLDYILKLKKDRGFTMIMVTHNRNIAETADRVICMNSGKIVDEYSVLNPKSAYEIGW
ncbi:MAG: ABC transporter ATP-binding protein [Clostridiales bacterium]|nr:ABC transporter ATP-binding protein [Clostridiales bacterium]